ncbi:PAS domain-containing sensor histidine kinase [Rhizobium sp. KAs_5_22]|uniref:ATP-binding protein n=1 Tax=Ciceribacter selenitireducens TaxID=448181 RepID=UPI00048C7D4F|nr:ATP-binding protein [Ciceribacter selenitireducens]PPJ47747.1 PAS domain-containing sensor histidine kinase [Rhizobium sp. KAs_5_22]
MPAPYPFIDVAVHDSIRPRFARGEALVVFSPALDRVLWANGAGARFFGNASIYDFLEEGPNRGDVTFRQIEGVARQLGAVGDSRSLLLRIASGFQRVPVTATAQMVEIRSGEPVVLLAVPPIGKAGSLAERAAEMLTGFDDPDTHMAVLDGEGQVVVASAKFAGLGITPQTARTLVTLAGTDADHLVKRPIPTGRGHLPAAIGKLSDDPALHLLFTVETILGHMDPTDSFDTEEPTGPTAPLPAALDEPAAEPIVSPEAAAIVTAGVVEAEAGFAEVVDAIGEIEEFEADEVEALDETDTDETGEEAVADAVSSETAAPGDAVLAEAAAEVVETLENEVGPLADTEAAELFPDADETVEVPSPQAELPLAAEAMPEIAAETLSTGDAETDTPVVDAQTDTPVDSALADDTLADAELPTPAFAAAESAAAPDEAPVAEAAAAIAAVPAAPSSEAPAGAFVFSPERRATRFVWKIDADGRFCDVSHEFAEAVGPHAADINGVAFTDLAALFNLDPEGKIGELLKKRDTWSGKTIHWPVEGTSLMVPVDLAALPTYTRSRDFDGFRGFGIVRMADAVEDPNRTGMTFVGEAAPSEPEQPEISEALAETVPSFSLLDDEADEADDAGFPAAETAPGDESADLLSGTSEGETVSDQDMPAANTAIEDETTAAAEDDLPRIGEPEFFEPPAEPPRSPATEPPALQIVETPGRRHSDKVVQLEERRARGKDGLTPGEQAAFLEIARKLDPQGLREKAAEALNEIRRNETATAAAEEAASSAATEQAEADREPTEAAEAPTVPETSPAEPLALDVAAESAPEREETTVEEFATLRLKRDNALTAEIVDLMPVALLVHVGDRLIHANPEFLALTGYASVEELDTAGGLDVLIQQQDLEGASEEPGRVVIVRADDQLVPVTARLQSIRFERATALMLALIPAGGTTQAAAEKPAAPHAVAAHPVAEPQGQAGAEQLARLQVEVDELRAILETATDGVVILGADGDIRSMNRAASALFNFDEAETRGKPFVMLFAHESQKSILDYLGGLSGHGVASVLNDGREVIGREASGGFLPLFMTIGKLTSSNGYCAVIRDITQWKRTEEELRNAKRAAETANAHKSDFLARVSHEIRTPLNAIIGFADMMANEHFGPVGHPRYGEYANDIVRSGRHVLDIVNDLLDISKIEAGEMDLDFTAVGLNETVQAAVSIVQPQANGQRVIIRTALSQAVPSVVADMRSIKQIVLNILANAIRFTPSGGQIIVSTAYEPNGSVALRIRDTGVGMTRTELEQAMKPFRQVHAGTRSRGDGTGLGLPLTKAMVDANRATFAISSAPNEGTLVEITFPSQRVLAD